MSTPPNDKSIWKKEITLRRKPKKETGTRVPPAPPETPKPDSVAELLRPLAADPNILNPVVLPPVTPLISQPTGLPTEALAPVVEPRDEPEPEAEVAEVPHAPVPEPVPVILPPPVDVPVEQPPPPEPTRRSRKQAEKQAKEERQQEERRAKAERRSGPAPQKRVVGLKIGGSQLAAAQVVNASGKGARVVRMARVPLERGVVVGGELREPEQLAVALKTFFRKNKLPKSAVRLGIANNRIGVRTFEINGIDDPKHLANAIRFRAQEALPIPLDEAVLDYRILDDRVGEDGVRTCRVLLVVAHKDLVQRYVAACRKAGLKLVGIDLEAFALLRALGDPARPQAGAQDAGLVCISIGHDRSTLAVSDGRVCEFTRVLAWGGSALDVALSRVLDLTPSEAEVVKHQLSLLEDGATAGLDAPRAETARKAMAAELQGFARELVASLRFYQEQPGSLGIGEILVTGGGAECSGLAEELEKLIGVTVRVADPLARVKVPRKVRKGHLAVGSLAVAVGLGIED